jgi:hypothetical protein
LSGMLDDKNHSVMIRHITCIACGFEYNKWGC